MAKPPVVEIAGLKELRRTLRKAGDDLADLKQANGAAAAVAADGGRDRVPTLTGLLGSTIRSAGTKTAGIVRVGKTAVPYANPIHWGWPSRNIPANPFLSAGAVDTQDDWLPIYEARIDEILHNVKGT